MTASASASCAVASGEQFDPLGRLEALFDQGTLTVLTEPASDRAVAVVTAIGAVLGRTVLGYAQDSRLGGGATGELEAKLILEVLEMARQRRVPVVGFLESAGARLQEGAAALGALGRVFYENVALSGRVPQISVVTGTAAGGGCYSPALTDFIVMTRESAMFLTGPRVVHAAVGEDVTAEALGGAKVHQRNGVCHFVVRDDLEAISVARELVGYLDGDVRPWGDESDHQVAPDDFLPPSAHQVYDIRDVVRSLVDDGRFLEVAPMWARNLVTGFARIRGQSIGIVANQPKHIGGVLDVHSSEKGARFVRTCDDHEIALLVLVDTPGFLPGLRQETAGVIRHGAQLVRAFAQATVPRVTVILRKAFGGAYITMNCKNLGADAALAWSGAEIGIMSPDAAVAILHRAELNGSAGSDLADRLAERYRADNISATRALELGLVDAIIKPRATREHVVSVLAAAAGGPARRMRADRAS